MKTTNEADINTMYKVGNKEMISSTNKVSFDDLEKIEILSKLELDKEEKEIVRNDMEDILAYVNKIKELDTSCVEPMTHIFDNVNVFREDYENGSNYTVEEMLENAPEKNDNCYIVPKTIK